MPPATSTETPRSASQLSTPVKAGIVTASIVVFLLVLLLVLEHTYLRRKRHERAVERAVERAIDEVERGTELKRVTKSESEENMVLESRVEIVVENEEQDDVGSWDGEGPWDVCTHDEDEDGDLHEWGRGRRREIGQNGMSLPRRDISFGTVITTRWLASQGSCLPLVSDVFYIKTSSMPCLLRFCKL